MINGYNNKLPGLKDQWCEQLNPVYFNELALILDGDEKTTKLKILRDYLYDRIIMDNGSITLKYETSPKWYSQFYLKFCNESHRQFLLDLYTLKILHDNSCRSNMNLHACDKGNGIYNDLTGTLLEARSNYGRNAIMHILEMSRGINGELHGINVHEAVCQNVDTLTVSTGDLFIHKVYGTYLELTEHDKRFEDYVNNKCKSYSELGNQSPVNDLPKFKHDIVYQIAHPVPLIKDTFSSDIKLSGHSLRVRQLNKELGKSLSVEQPDKDNADTTKDRFAHSCWSIAQNPVSANKEEF
jgi:hypothetical protein